MKLPEIKKLFDFLIYGFGQAVNLISPFLVIPFLILKCGLANYGKIGAAMAVMFFVIVVIDYGSDIIGVKEISVNRENPDQLRKIFHTTYTAKFFILMGISVILSVLFFTVPYFSDERPLFFFSLTILLGQFLNPTWFLQGMERFRMITVLNVLSKFLYVAAVFVFIKKPEDYIYVNLFWGAGMIVPFLYGISSCIVTYNISFIEIKRADVRAFLKAHYKFCISQLFLSLKNYSPVILISAMGGFSIAGQYKVIEQIIMPFRTYMQVFFRFFYPKLCFEIFKNEADGISYWKKINAANGCIVIAGLCLTYVFSEQILVFFKVKPDTLSYMNAILKYSLLLPLLLIISFTFEQLLFSFEKREFYIRITIATVLLNFVLMSLLFGRFGLNGLIDSLLITEASVITCYFLIVRKLFSRHTFFKS